jgi:hypothetical protein
MAPKLIAIGGDSPETTMVAMKPIADGIGLDWEGQRQRIERHPVLSSSACVLKVKLPRDQQARRHVFLPLNRVNFWLATIESGQVDDKEARSRVISYQTECADVLFWHFFGKAVVARVNGEMSADNRRVIGGIAKSVVGKALAERLAPLEIKLAKISDALQRLAMSAEAEFKPMLAFLVDLGVPATLSQRCSARIRRWLFLNDRNAEIRISPETGRFLYHAGAVADWLKAEGNKFITGAAR